MCHPAIPTRPQPRAPERRECQSAHRLGGFAAGLMRLLIREGQPASTARGHHGHDHLNQPVVPAGQQWVRPRGCGPRAPRPHHGHRPDQPVRLRAAPGRPDHADPGRPAAPGLRLEHRPGTKAIWRIFSPRALPEKGGSPPLIGVDSGSVVDCVHHRPPEQPPSPNQPRKWGGSCVRGR